LRAKISPGAGARVVLHCGPQANVPGEPLLSVMASESMPGWSLSMYLDRSDPLAAAAHRQMALYLWTAALGIGLILVLMLLVGGYIGRQMRLTRMKNDLIATVSHELKTPLASMRMLVDTLLEGRCRDSQQAGEYLTLIARENDRLSRLIDNFLTFSRMERNKRTFEKAPVDVADVVRAAEQSIRERFSAPGCCLEVQIQSPLPPVTGDRDALITVVLNLLDNAYKYTRDEKRVRARAFADRGSICIEVSDNGIGLARREVRSIFDRFYQVDQTLSRQTGGCGLGLSIVRFIVEAHSGTIRVDSRPEQGSRFTVTLPAASGPLTPAAEEEPVSHGR
ncbi:MAG: sensor histidine kinase, partial [Bacillota bacterium]